MTKIDKMEKNVITISKTTSAHLLILTNIVNKYFAGKTFSNIITPYTYDDYWDAVPALRDFKKAVEEFWDKNGKNYVPGADGRKLNTRSKHSLMNLLFQSFGVIAMKYVTILLMQDMENKGYCTDPFKGTPEVCSMIEYHK